MFGQKEVNQNFAMALGELMERLGLIKDGTSNPRTGPMLSDWVVIEFAPDIEKIFKGLFIQRLRDQSYGELTDLLKKKYKIELSNEFNKWPYKIECFRSPLLPVDIIVDHVTGESTSAFRFNNSIPIFSRNGASIVEAEALNEIEELWGCSRFYYGSHGCGYDFEHYDLPRPRREGAPENANSQIHFQWGPGFSWTGSEDELGDFLRAVYWNFNRGNYPATIHLPMREILQFPKRIQEAMDKHGTKYRFSCVDGSSESDGVSQELPDNTDLLNAFPVKKQTYADWKARTGARLGIEEGDEGWRHVFYNDWGEIRLSLIPLGARLVSNYL